MSPRPPPGSRRLSGTTRRHGVGTTGAGLGAGAAGGLWGILTWPLSLLWGVVGGAWYLFSECGVSSRVESSRVWVVWVVWVSGLSGRSGCAPIMSLASRGLRSSRWLCSASTSASAPSGAFARSSAFLIATRTCVPTRSLGYAPRLTSSQSWTLYTVASSPCLFRNPIHNPSSPAHLPLHCPCCCDILAVSPLTPLSPHLPPPLLPPAPPLLPPPALFHLPISSPPAPRPHRRDPLLHPGRRAPDLAVGPRRFAPRVLHRPIPRVPIHPETRGQGRDGGAGV